ncbi:hypothetical protein TWF696_006606 [Orbilia brochopaga]|uniref:Uncharacterized protein n=1 Tax=Orbilia brochopaga TaxID=3140254 RepID=A0AAV9UVK8_9PEZI
MHPRDEHTDDQCNYDGRQNFNHDSSSHYDKSNDKQHRNDNWSASNNDKQRSELWRVVYTVWRYWVDGNHLLFQRDLQSPQRLLFPVSAVASKEGWKGGLGIGT